MSSLMGVDVGFVPAANVFLGGEYLEGWGWGDYDRAYSFLRGEGGWGKGGGDGGWGMGMEKGMGGLEWGMGMGVGNGKLGELAPRGKEDDG